MPVMIAPKVLSFASMIEDGVIEQASVTASMPFIHSHVALMPDVHVGLGSSVGTVIPTVGAVIPAAVGVDVGCGMTAAATTFTVNDLHGKILRELLSSVESAIPLSPGNYNKKLDQFPFTVQRISDLEELAEQDGVDLSHSPKWREQLGSLGGGNHFIELCADQNDQIWLFLHSGSRGVGNKIAQKHIKIAKQLCKLWYIQLPHPDLAYLPQGTPEFSRYIKDLNWAQKFAHENRAEMMDRFVRAFAYFMGRDPSDVGFVLEQISSHHNYTKMENHFGKDVWLTRKGAVDASEGKRGLIPGSMGTRSFVVTGKGCEAAYRSAPHGAGRRFSRTKARQEFTVEDLAESMVGIVYRHGEQWVDEIAGAYKPIDQVMADAADLVEVTHELRQLLNVKGT